MADVKAENIASIKPEPDTTDSPMGGDADAYEDDHDLQIPPPPPNGPQAWLVKLPKYVWQAWASIYREVSDDQPIEIGKMRVFNPPADGKEGAASAEADPMKQKIQIHLTPGVPQHVELPKVYNVNLSTNGYNNTLVFSEKDLSQPNLPPA